MRCYVDMLLITSTANIKTWERDNGLYGGLSPLARGTWALPEWGLFCTRFIPAAAGNSQGVEKWLILIWVYPRWRGELKLFLIQCGRSDGLSPLARGTLGRTTQGEYSRRFIPAGAGNSHSSSARAYANAVYPRWRGELVKRFTWRVNKTRFIPAGAGNSAGPPNVFPVAPVYPRWRGELWFWCICIISCCGLSPLARGTL